MTAAEYSANYARERRQWPFITAKTMKAIHAAYAEAGRKIADIIRNGELVDGALSFDTQRQVDQAILEGSQAIGDAMREGIPALLTAGALGYAAIETAYLVDALGDASGKITTAGVEKLFTATSEASVLRSLNTVGADGRIFWSRVPNVSSQFGDDILAMVRASIDQGRDLGKIAADVNKYIRDGKAGTIHRWGENITPDSKQLLKRVPEHVDYRALRLARSELGRGLRETALANGQSNPGGTGLFDWVRVNAIDWGCNCPANAANGPYLAENYPPYDHPNDQCYARQILKNGTDFRNSLQAWVNGGADDDLDAWYQNSYIPAQFSA